MKGRVEASPDGGGTVRAPTYYEGHVAPDVNVSGDECLHTRLYTYRTEKGLVAGWTMSVIFTIDRSPREVWPYLKDFNLWQPGHYYSGVVGDLEGQIYTSSYKPNDSQSEYRRQVLRVIPEHVIVSTGLVPPEGTGWPGLPGVGGVSPSFSLFLLTEHGGKTIVNVFMEHAAHASRAPEITVQEALAPWQDEKISQEWQRKWREDFIPALKTLVYQAHPTCNRDQTATME